MLGYILGGLLLTLEIGEYYILYPRASGLYVARNWQECMLGVWVMDNSGLSHLLLHTYYKTDSLSRPNASIWRASVRARRAASCMCIFRAENNKMNVQTCGKLMCFVMLQSSCEDPGCFCILGLEIDLTKKTKALGKLTGAEMFRSSSYSHAGWSAW